MTKYSAGVDCVHYIILQWQLIRGSDLEFIYCLANVLLVQLRTDTEQ